MADAEQGAGDIAITLDGNEMLLVPTLQACLTISRIAGGLQAAATRCSQLDADTINAIIIAGLGLNPVQAKMVPEAVYKTGLFNVSGPCIDFINVVGNGGRALTDDEGDGDNADADPTPPASQ